VSWNEPDLYAVLGVAPDASAEALKQAYRRRVLELHPDKNPGNPEAQARLQAVTDAYNLLKDATARHAYDERRRVGTPRADWADPWLGRRQPERGADLKFRLELDLEAIAEGVERTIAVDRAEACDLCAGSGGRPGSVPIPCAGCGGRGHRGGWLVGGRCPDCRGAGRRFEQSCPVCGGVGRRRTKHRQTVRVPRAAASGTRLRYPKAGDVGVEGGARGDLFVVIVERPHPLFAREGLDLIATVPLTIAQAVLGGDVEVPTLRGKKTLRVDPGTASGREVALPGEGLVDERGRVGAIRVRWTIEVPAALTSAQKKLFEELRELERCAPPDTRWERIRAQIAARPRS